MVLIGDGILGVVQPSRHVARWESGPWARSLERARRRPTLVRVMAGAEVLVAVWYAGRLSGRERTSST